MKRHLEVFLLKEKKSGVVITETDLNFTTISLRLIYVEKIILKS